MKGTSNSILAVLLVVAIVVSLAGIFIPKTTTPILPVTGMATDSETGTAGGSITETTDISFTTSDVDWGTGSVITGSASCTLTTASTGGSNGSGGCSGFTLDPADLVLENIGTEKVSIQLFSDLDADGLVGGTAATNEFQYRVLASGSETCEDIAPATLTDVNTTDPGTLICNTTNGLDAIAANDTIKIDLSVVIPSDSTKSGDQTAIFTAKATEIAD